jgi:aminoglycoside N3'-acetyltransferase
MYTKKDLLNHLEQLKINPAGTLMVHVSYKCCAVKNDDSGFIKGRFKIFIEVLIND